jgi:proteasome lid subunit RPN8/RPN11
MTEGGMSVDLSIRLAEELAKRMCEHAMEAYPHECCGALLGRDQISEPAGRQILDVLPIANRENGSPRSRFSLSAEDVLQAEKQARALGLDVVGWYHSHPDHPARPSETDREHALPWYSYIILSVVNGHIEDMRSWRLKDDRSDYGEETVTIHYVSVGEDSPK